MPGKTLYCLGEAWLELNSTAPLASAETFSPRMGGSAASLALAYAAQGGRASLLTQLGEDAFGHRIADALSTAGVDISRVCFTSRAPTPLLFDGGMGTYYKGAPGRECEQANRLDPEGIRWIRGLLRGHADAGGTVLLSSHLLHEIEIIADDQDFTQDWLREGQVLGCVTTLGKPLRGCKVVALGSMDYVAAVSPGAARIDKNFSVAVVVREYMGMSENYKIRIREIKRQVSFVMDKIK